MTSSEDSHHTLERKASVSHHHKRIVRKSYIGLMRRKIQQAKRDASNTASSFSNKQKNQALRQESTPIQHHHNKLQPSNEAHLTKVVEKRSEGKENKKLGIFETGFEREEAVLRVKRRIENQILKAQIIPKSTNCL